MATKLIKRNKIARNLFSKKFQQRVIKPKKGKGSFKRKKKIILLPKFFSNYHMVVLNVQVFQSF